MASARGFALLGLRFMAGISCKVIRWAAPWILGLRTRFSPSIRGVWTRKSSWQEPHFRRASFGWTAVALHRPSLAPLYYSMLFSAPFAPPKQRKLPTFPRIPMKVFPFWAACGIALVASGEKGTGPVIRGVLSPFLLLFSFSP